MIRLLLIFAFAIAATACASNKPERPTYNINNVTELTLRYCMDRSGYPRRKLPRWEFDEQAEHARQGNPPPLPIDDFNKCMDEHWHEEEARQREQNAPAKEVRSSVDVSVL